MPLHLEAHRPLDGAERVDVLGLGAGAEHAAALRGQREVHVGTQVALVHPGLGDAEGHDQVAQLLHVGAGDGRSLLPRAEDRAGDDLDEGDAGAVVVDQGVVGAVDATRGPTDVRGLPGVLLHVRALDLHAEGLPVDLDVHVPVEGDGLVVLAGLEVLRHVRVEVVLPGEAAPLGDVAVQREADADRGLDRLAVDHRHRAGQAQAGRAHVGVGLPAEGGRAAAEHLGGGVELDVDLQAQRRVVRRQYVLERDEGLARRTHRATPSNAGTLSRRGPPHRSCSAASRAAPTR